MLLGMGDYLDTYSTSERAILRGGLHDSTIETFEKLSMRHVNTIVKELMPFKGKIIGLIEGNHYSTFGDGTTSTQRMCQLLGCRYLGVSSFIRLSFSSNERKSVSLSLDVWAHHGKGAARLVGGSLNRVQQMAEIADAQILLMGHDHKKSIATMSKLYLSHGQSSIQLRYKKQLYARTGSFLKSYEDDKASYVADACLNPSDLGVVKIELTPKRKENKEDGDYTYIDIHASL